MLMTKNERRSTYEHDRTLNGKATQNNGLKWLFLKVRTYRRLWTLPLTWIVESAGSFHTIRRKK